MKMKLTWWWCLHLSACLSISLITFGPTSWFQTSWQKHNYIPRDFVKINGLIAKRDPNTVPDRESCYVGSCLIRFQIFHKSENTNKHLICMKSFKWSLCLLRHSSQSTTIYKYTGDAALLVPVLTKLLVGLVFFFLYQRVPSALLFHVWLNKISLILGAVFIRSCTM